MNYELPGVARSVLCFAAPLLTVRVFCALSYFCVSAGKQQGMRIADLGLDNAEVAGRVEEAGIPALPVGQQLFNLVAK